MKTNLVFKTTNKVYILSPQVKADELTHVGGLFKPEFLEQEANKTRPLCWQEAIPIASLYILYISMLQMYDLYI